MRDEKRKEQERKKLREDDVRMNDKSLSPFIMVFSISGSLRRSSEPEREEDSNRNRCELLAKEGKKERRP